MNRSMQAKNMKLKKLSMMQMKDRAYRIMQDAKDPRNPIPAFRLSEHPHKCLNYKAKKKCIALGLI